MYIERNIPAFIINSQLRTPGGQTNIKSFIQNFNTLMIDAGLIRSPLPNQLDVNAIPDLVMDNIYTQSYYVNGNGIGLNSTTRDVTRFAMYAPIEYMFNDSLSPVYIKFEFYYYNGHRKSVYKATDVPQFACYVTVNNGFHSHRYNYNIPFSYASPPTDYDSWPDLATLSIIDKNRPSVISYNKDSGHLYINLLPVISYSFGFSSTQPAMSLSFMSFIVTRSHSTYGTSTSDYVRLVTPPSIAVNSNGYAAPVTLPVSTSSYYISITLSYSSTNTQTTVESQYSAPANGNVSYSNYSYYTFMSNNINIVKSTADYDPYILIGSTDMSGYVSNSIYKIKLGNNVVKSYLALSNIENNCIPGNGNSRLCLLVQIDKE